MANECRFASDPIAPIPAVLQAPARTAPKLSTTLKGDRRLQVVWPRIFGFDFFQTDNSKACSVLCRPSFTPGSVTLVQRVKMKSGTVVLNWNLFFLNNPQIVWLAHWGGIESCDSSMKLAYYKAFLGHP